MALRKKKNQASGAESGGGSAGGATPPQDGKRSRRRKGRDRTPPGWAPPSMEEGAPAASAPPPPPSAPPPADPASQQVPVTGGTSALPAYDASFFRWLSDQKYPSKEAAEQEAARELQSAAGPSLDLLVSSVPGSSSPDEAYSTIESNLGPSLDDPDKVIPQHPLWSDDTVIYYHLRRHFGENAGTVSMQRRRPSWFPIKPFGELE